MEPTSRSEHPIPQQAAPEQTAPGEIPLHTRGGWKKPLGFTLLFLLVLLVGATVCLRLFVFRYYYMPASSMEPTLMGHDAGTNPVTGEAHDEAIHDHFSANILTYRFHAPERGDIIVFKAPASADTESLTVCGRDVRLPTWKQSRSKQKTFNCEVGSPRLEPWRVAP
jgi:hypothetical protein